MEARVLARSVVRLGLAALCASAVAACATPAVLERARGSTETESRPTTLRSVKRAGMLDGDLLVCLEIRNFKRKLVSFEVPLDEIGTPRPRQGFDFGRERGFDGPSPDDPTTLRYVFFEEDLDAGCPEPDEILPVYAADPAKQPRGPGVYATRTASGLTLRYVSAKPLWSSLRNLELSPVLQGEEREVEVKGKPLYYLAVPFALALDLAFTLVTFGLLL